MPRAEDPLFTAYREAFQGYYDVPCPTPVKDFVQLAKLKKTCSACLESRWPAAVRNYFLTPLPSHTLADLCVRFATFQKYPLDRFGKPVLQKHDPRANLPDYKKRLVL